jgi:hypothetical protein
MRTRRLLECFLPPHPALSLGERENHSPREDETESLVCSQHVLSCSLSPRERARVRGNKATFGPWDRQLGKLSNVASRRGEPEVS